MISKAVEYLILAALVVLAGWWFYDEIGDHFREPLIAAHKEAIATQAKANSQAVANLQIKKTKGEAVYVDRIREIKFYAENLPKNDACLADAEFVRLHSSAVR